MKFEAWPVDPPGLGSGPLSMRTTSRQPSRHRWYATLLPTMPHPITTTRAWAGRSLIAFGSPSSVRLVGRADLLGQLVPAHPVAHLGPQLPLQRLRLRLDRRPQVVQPRPHQDAVDVELVERLAQLPDVHLQRSVQAPVVGRDASEIARVDRVVVVLRYRMVQPPCPEVAKVFAIDLVDLQLAQEQVGRARARALAVQAVAKVDDVGHLEPVDEDVDLAVLVLFVEVEPAVALHQV